MKSDSPRNPHLHSLVTASILIGAGVLSGCSSSPQTAPPVNTILSALSSGSGSSPTSPTSQESPISGSSAGSTQLSDTSPTESSVDLSTTPVDSIASGEYTTDSSQDITASPSDAATIGDGSGSQIDATTGPSVLGLGSSGRTLGLSDIFDAEGSWTESRFDVVDSSSVSGLGVPLGSCGESHRALLELRLAGHFTTLNMKVGQANTSASSGDVLDAQVITNGKQQDLRKIPFNTKQTFTVPVKDVNALKLIFFVDQDKCDNKGVTAVIQGLTVS